MLPFAIRAKARGAKARTGDPRIRLQRQDLDATGRDVNPVPLRDAAKAYGRIAASSFGGPAAQIALIHRVVVEEKRWLDEPAFVRALSFCMLLPGPEAQQLVSYVGWKLHGLRGALTAGLLFVAPGFATMLLLSILYATAADISLVAALFVGLKPAVLPVVLEAVARLKRRAAGGVLGTMIAANAFVAIFVFHIPFPLIVLFGALAGFLAERRTTPSTPSVVRDEIEGDWRRTLRVAGTWLLIWLAPVASIVFFLGRDHVLSTQAAFFSKVAVVTFGGAYAVLAYVAQQAVDVFGWLTPGEMLDGLGLAETTPGPLIMVVQFVAFLGAFRQAGSLDPILAGIIGSLVTVWVTFAPSFLFILVGAPWIERITRIQRLAAALAGVTAAVVGVVLNLGVWFAVHTLFADVTDRSFGWLSLPVPDPSTFQPAVALIASAAAIAIFRFRISLLWVLAGGAALGVVARTSGFA
jgi:chromate transporter